MTVYAVGALGTSFFKVGYAKNVDLRIRDLQVGCPHELLLLGSIEGGEQVELDVHKLVLPLRIRGEWFDWKRFKLLPAMQAFKFIQIFADGMNCENLVLFIAPGSALQLGVSRLEVLLNNCSLDGFYSAVDLAKLAQVDESTIRNRWIPSISEALPSEIPLKVSGKYTGVAKGLVTHLANSNLSPSDWIAQYLFPSLERIRTQEKRKLVCEEKAREAIRQELMEELGLL